MNLVAELSLYPLRDDPLITIETFIRELRRVPGLTIRTNQMSTQVSGEFDQVTGAVNACLRNTMREQGRCVLVAKYLNAEVNLDEVPLIE